MSNRKKNNETGRALLTVLLAVLILAAVVTVVILLVNGGKGARQPENTIMTEENELPVIDVTADPQSAEITIPFEIPGFTLLQEAEVGMLDGELELLGVGRYSGAYFEDGSDEQVSDVYAVVVRNNGEDWVDFAAITVSCGSRTLTFELSALPGATSAIVLEANRQTWSAGESCRNPHAVLTADTSERRFDFDDDFVLYPSDGVINIKNISGKTFDKDILLYYKNFDYGLFLGGVTYRARYAGLAPDGIGQSIQPHYSDARSTILYMSYDD